MEHFEEMHYYEDEEDDDQEEDRLVENKAWSNSQDGLYSIAEQTSGREETQGAPSVSNTNQNFGDMHHPPISRHGTEISRNMTKSQINHS